MCFCLYLPDTIIPFSLILIDSKVNCLSLIGSLRVTCTESALSWLENRAWEVWKWSLMKSRRFGILTTVTSCPVPDETTPKPKKIFLFQMSTEFSKDIFNGPQNWNELIQELPFASVVCSLRLKRMPFHRQERRVCSIHTPRTFKKNCWDEQHYWKMQSYIYTVMFSMYEVIKYLHSTSSAFERWVCESFCLKFSFSAELLDENYAQCRTVAFFRR